MTTAAVSEQPSVRPDRESIRIFCDVLFAGTEGHVPVRILGEKGGPATAPVTPFPRVNAGLGDTLCCHAEEAAASGVALYVVPGTVARPGRAGVRDVVQLTTVLVDLDAGEIEAKKAHLVEHLGEPSLVVASGGVTSEGQPKFHLYWRLTEPATGSALQLLCSLRREIAHKAGGDPAFASAHQPIRVAGSVYAKHGARRLVTIIAQSRRTVDLAALAETVSHMPPLPGLALFPEDDGMAALPKARELLTRPVRQGGVDGQTRFATLTRVAGYWIRRVREGQASLDDAWTEIAAYNEALVRPPWPEPELRAEFDRLFRLDERNHGPLPGARTGETSAGHAGPPPLSEDALAQGFTARHGQDWRYVAAWGGWLGWDGVRWRRDETARHLDLVRRICRDAAAAADAAREARRLASQKTIAAVERIARTDPAHAAEPVIWDPDPLLLNTPGGIVDLRTGETRPHDRTVLMTRLAGASPGGDCPRWRRFLDEVTGGDRDLAAYLQRLAGYCLTGCTEEHALFFLHGDGGNGKSIFVSVLAAVLGDYAKTAALDTFMAAHGERHPTDLAGLRGARMVSVVETEEGRRWAEGKIKSVTGGDTIRARFMRQDFFEFRPEFKLVVFGNHRPVLRSVDEAIRRRLHLVPFAVTIPPERMDLRLRDKLLAERDGILAWALAGCAAWQRLGLAPPKAVTGASQTYLEEEDTIGDWLAERCLEVPGGFVPTTVLYADWWTWAEAAGEAPFTKNRLARQLNRRGYRQRRGPRGARGFSGVQIKPAEAAPESDGGGQ